MKSLIAFICRHGETKLNTDNRFRSWLDVHLDENGEKQADDVADILEQYPITEIYSSPLYRTVYTAEQFAKRVGLPINQTRGLFPWNLGLLAGTSKIENNDLLLTLVENPSIKAPNGESLEDFENRIAEFCDTHLLNKKKGISAIFCHTSNIIAIESLISGERKGPETNELVKPGGICALYRINDWFSIEPIFRKSETEEY